MAAAELLDIGGPRAVTLRAVAERVGMSHNAPYKHFASKEALLASIAARELNALADVLAEEGRSLEEVLVGYVDWALRYPNRFRLAFGPWDKGSPDLNEAARLALRNLGSAVSRAQDKGQIRQGDSERLGALIQATVHGALEMELNGHLSSNGKHNMNAQDLALTLLGMLAPSRVT